MTLGTGNSLAPVRLPRCGNMSRCAIEARGEARLDCTLLDCTDAHGGLVTTETGFASPRAR